MSSIEPGSGASSFVHRGAFYSSTDDVVEQVVDRTREAWSRGRHMIALLDSEVESASAERLGSNASDVDFRPQAWLSTRSAPAIIATCLGGGADMVAHEPLAMLTQSPLASKDSDEAYWYHCERQLATDLAARAVDLVCMFDAVASTESHLHTARVSHPVLIVDGVDCPNPDFRPYDELFPPYELADSDELGAPDQVVGFGPYANIAVKQWLESQAASSGLRGDVVDDLTLVVNEAVTTSWETGYDQTVQYPASVEDWPRLPLTRVHLWRQSGAMVCEVYTPRPLAALSPLSLPLDSRLRMLWFAEKVSSQVSVSVHDGAPHSSGSRIRIRASR